MKKIVFILPTLNIGGIEKVTLDLIESLKNRYEIHLIVLNYDGKGFLCPEGICFHNLNVRRARYAFFEINKILENFINEIVFSPVSYITIILAFLKIKKKFTLISVEHGLVSYRLKDIESFFYKFFYKSLLKKSFNYVDRFIFVSQAAKKDWMNCFKFNFNDADVIYNRIDFEIIDKKINDSNVDIKDYFLNLISNKKTIISVGRLSKEKNIILGCEAFLRFKEKYPNSIYIILGDGEERQKIENWIHENGMKNSIILMGFQKNPYYFLSRSDMLLITSHHEALPTIVIEALFMNKFIVSVNCPGGIKEICKNLPNAKIVSNGSSVNISNSMHYFAENNNIVESKNTMLEKFGNINIIESYIRIIESYNV